MDPRRLPDVRTPVAVGEASAADGPDGARYLATPCPAVGFPSHALMGWSASQGRSCRIGGSRMGSAAARESFRLLVERNYTPLDAARARPAPARRWCARSGPGGAARRSRRTTLPLRGFVAPSLAASDHPSAGIAPYTGGCGRIPGVVEIVNPAFLREEMPIPPPEHHAQPRQASALRSRVRVAVTPFSAAPGVLSILGGCRPSSPTTSSR